jgi:hypothetical protein
VAVAFDEYAPFDSGAGANVTEDTWRKMMKFAGHATGVVRGQDNALATTGDSSGMQVKVATGQVWIEGHWGRSSSIKTVPLTAAHATLARKDYIVARADFVNNRIEFDSVTGTPHASPALPSLTTNTSIHEIALAEVAVAAAASTITSGNVTDRRQFDVAAAKYTKTGTQAITTGTTYTKVSCSANTTYSGDISANTANTEWTLNRTGWWIIAASVSWGTGTTGYRQMAITNTAVSTFYAKQKFSASPDENQINLSTALQVQGGTAFSLAVRHTQGSNCDVNSTDDGTWIAFTWIGN